jgi:hypothetical protein
MSISLAAALLASVGSSLLASPATAAVKSWNAGSGSWNVGANWSPIGVPTPADDVFIGNLFSVENDWVTLGSNTTVANLSITDGMALDTNGSTFAVTGSTFLSGYNSINGFGYPSRLQIDQNPAATDCVLSEAILEDEAWLRITNGATLLVTDLLDLGPGTLLSGEGTLLLDGDQNVAMRADGAVSAGTGGFTITQQGNGRIDLDGSVAGDQILNLTLAKIDGSAFAWLTINGDGLLDPFDEEIWLSGNNVLTMNLDEGWTMGPSTILRVFANTSFPAPAEINGSALTFRGHLHMNGSNKLMQFNAPVTLDASASGGIGIDGRAEFNATTTVDGGPWILDEGADIDFDGSTTVLGGEFLTFNANASSGAVDFNGPTTWNGDVTVVGAARQRGDATVFGPTTIDATRFDFDGDGATAWSIGNSLTVAATYLDAGTQNILDGDILITGTFLGKLTMLLEAPSTHWTMNGTMDLGGIGGLLSTRVAGSEMRVTGDLNVSGRIQVTADTILKAGSITALETPTSVLRLSGDSLIEVNASLVGEGTIEVGAGGHLSLVNLVSLNNLGLRNFGELELGGSPGEAIVDRFENASGGTWIVEIGGDTPGLEHDFLTVSSGDALLDGILDVRVIDAGSGLFEPLIGDSFTILSAPGSVSGSFDNAPISFVPGKIYLWTVSTTPDEVAVHLDDIVPCPADLNGDGMVDGADLGLLLAAWGPCEGCIEDIGVDGAVDGADLGLLLAAWGACSY